MSTSASPLRYLVVTVDGGGNQPPVLSIAQQLQDAGHTVIVAGFASQQQRVQQANLTFALLTQANGAFMSAVTALMAAGQKPDLGVVVQHCLCSAPVIQHDVPGLMAEHRIDRLLVDVLMFSCLAMVEAQGLQSRSYVIVHSSPHAIFPADGSGFSAMALPAVNMVRGAVQLPPLTNVLDMFRWCGAAEYGGRRALTTSVEALNPTPDLLPPNTFDFIGQRRVKQPLAQEDWQAGTGWKADDPRPLVLVSFHTTPVFDQRSRVERTLQALADPAPYRVLATTSAVDMTGLTVPANAVVRPFIPHEEVLPAVSVVVTHAGHGTVIAALSHGLPLLCLPNPVADQPALGQRVSQLECGLTLDGETATPEEIRAAVDQLVSESRFRTAAQKLVPVIAAASKKPLLC